MPDSARPLLVSAIVPIYNHARYVEATLDSLAAQDYPRLEVIAIDDGSTDASLSIAQDWFARNGHRFERWDLQGQENAGITRTCNRLVARSSGALLFPLASDDEALANAISTLAARHDPAAPAVLFSDVQIMDMDGVTIATGTQQWRGRDIGALARSRGYLRWQLLSSWGTPFQHQVIPRSLFDALGGYDEALPFEDVSLALRAAARGAVRMIPECTRRYRVRPGSSRTPGIAEADWTLRPSRLAARSEFDLRYRILIDMLNWRDTLPKGVRRSMLAGAIAFADFAARGFSR